MIQRDLDISLDQILLFYKKKIEPDATFKWNHLLHQSVL